MRTLLITRTLPEAVTAEARKLFDVTVREETDPLDEAAAASALMSHDAILPTIGDAFSGEVFSRVPMPRARVLANFGVGVNHIDVAAARAAGVTVTNTPGAVTEATADIAMALVLMSCRRLGEGERLVRAGRWTGWQPTQLLGMHLGGRTLGIVGMGRIGKAIARRAKLGFGMEVIFHNRSEVADPGVGAEQVRGLLDVARRSDVVVLAVPATPETHHMIDTEFLAMMQSHAHLVNIARGDVVDEEALTLALARHQIGGAGLDVYEHEPQVPAALRAFENVVVLPHLGTAALEVREAMGRMALENLRAVAEGRPPPNPVT